MKLVTEAFMNTLMVAMLWERNEVSILIKMMIKRYFTIVFIFLMLVSILTGCKIDDKMEGKALGNNNLQKKIQSLEKGMSYKTVTDMLGQPDEPVGSGLVIVKYNLEGDSYLILNFGKGKGLEKATLCLEDGSEQYLIK